MYSFAQCSEAIRTGAKSVEPAVAPAPPRELHLTPEEHEDYLEIYDSYVIHYAPATPLEAHLVRKCAIAESLLLRAQSIQHTLVDLQSATAHREINDTYENLDGIGHRTVGFQLLNDKSTSFRNMDTHQARLLRELSHYLERLEKVCGKPPKKRPPKANEPETAPKPEVSLS